MTAYGIGRDLGESVEPLGNDNELLTYVGKVLSWIPADVVAVYTASVAAFVDNPQEDPHWWLIVAAAAAGVALVVIGRLSKGFSKDALLSWKLLVRIMLLLVAFVIWTPTVPNSGWQDIKRVSDNPEMVVGICAFAGIVFAALADQIKKWVESP